MQRVRQLGGAVRGTRHRGTHAPGVAADHRGEILAAVCVQRFRAKTIADKLSHGHRDLLQRRQLVAVDEPSAAVAAAPPPASVQLGQLGLQLRPRRL